MKGLKGLVFPIAVLCAGLIRMSVNSLSELGSYFWAYVLIVSIAAVFGAIEMRSFVKESRTEKIKLALAFKHGHIYPEMVPLRYRFIFPFKIIAQMIRDDRMGSKRRSYPLDPNSPVKRKIRRLAKKLSCECEKTHVC